MLKSHVARSVLSGLLPNELTREYESFEDEIVYAVNDEPVEDLAHLSSLLDNGTSKLVTIMMERGDIMVLDRAQVQQLTPQVLNRYQVTADRSPQLMSAPMGQKLEKSSGAAFFNATSP